MKYRCYNCGKIFDESDAGVESECVGEFWGSPAYNNYNVCPACNSEDIDEYTGEEEEGEEDAT